MKFQEILNEMLNSKDPNVQRWRDLLLNPVSLLAGFEMEWRKTKNPIHVQYAIELCLEEGIPFPNWISAYLLQTAKRFMSPQARESKDLRKALPWILGFPPKAERGAYPLRPYEKDECREEFADAFEVEIMKGEKPIEALHNAVAVLDSKTGDKIDDKTLWRWLKDYFELETKPRDNAEWRAAFDRLHLRLLRGLLADQFRIEIRESSS